ncbi:ABC transporter [Sphingomonas spermidinifaciens]|uniref:ABC transporter n=1 Tax=Sphingomonas spermidinifaciens TaxID=1141889 RepID=A0A2A4B4E1_9SPHN|nr:ABC transporter ATP-binding protein [Sphingomonas spermidinifaciens]PCD02940.1 ABC transporter [Sphingomonas spermidinifaciens]
MTRLSLADVTLRRGGRFVLESVDAVFEAGRLTAVIGPNGAGKSTLLEVAAGLLRPDAGEVLLGGEPIRAIAPRRLASIRAYLPQSPRAEWPVSVERLVALGLSPQLPAFGSLPARWQPAIDGALARFDLLALRERSATRLSGGELARAMLARAVVAEPRLLIVDEPSAGLDPRHAHEAARQLRALADGGCTVVVALHDLDLAARIADEVVALKDGRLLAAGPARDVLTGPILTALYDMPVKVEEEARDVSIRFGD